MSRLDIQLPNPSIKEVKNYAYFKHNLLEGIGLHWRSEGLDRLFSWADWVALPICMASLFLTLADN
ncbi:protein of unknown function [Legionella micdadei]|uniref:Uncharacterized protein n=1 Tax=Legionella micdadei TaxID=451 RepID=A0A098GFZ6_LEGMI|nr:protein of unknown function [Legionella micdadei]